MAAATRIECSICTNEMREVSTIALSNCGHDTACVRCCMAYVAETARKRYCGNVPVPCYERGCDQIVDKRDLITIANHFTHDHQDEDEGGEEASDARQATLAKCLRLFEPWVTIQPAERSAEDQAWFDQHRVKHCPRCKSPIQKDGGCIDVVCGCGHHFCFGCGGAYSSHLPGGCTGHCTDTAF